MASQRDFEDQHGIITGAASGIGRATAIYLAKRGANLSLGDLSLDGLEEVSAKIELSGSSIPLIFKVDMTSGEGVEYFAKVTLGEFKKIVFLVTSAGIFKATSFTKLEPTEWDFMMAVNLRGPYLCCRAVVPAMIKQGKGNIVNIASVAGRSASAWGGAHYTASRHGVVGLSRNLARELGPYSIRVNAFCPGGTITPMVLNATTQEAREETTTRIPLRRWGMPEEQARVIAFLLSDDSSYINSAAIDSNGGTLMV